MKKRPSSTQVIAVVLFLAACVLGVLSQRSGQQAVEIPRARYSDATPLGGKGLRLLLERLGYRTRVEGRVLKSAPGDAQVWLILDPATGFSRREATDLLNWVRAGGTLIWAATPRGLSTMAGDFSAWTNPGLAHLRRELKIAEDDGLPVSAFTQNAEPLPPLSPLKASAVSDVWSGVQQASGSNGGLEVERAHLALAGSPVDTQLAQIDLGRGRVFLAPDALMFTNYALARPDNAVLVSNLVRLHAPAASRVVFDERQHGEQAEEKVEPSWLYYLWRPPLRYAVMQLLVAGLLAALLYGRRLGAPVPLPDAGPVTRASQWAQAMGALFQKVGRPKAAGVVIGENFRRQLTRRLGLSIDDDDELIAKRAADATGYSARVIDRLLLQARTPDEEEARTLSDAQEMEMILRSLDQR